MKTSIYEKHLFTRYEKKSIKELVSLSDLVFKKIVSAYSQPIEAEQLTKIQMQDYVLLKVIQQKRERFEFED